MYQFENVLMPNDTSLRGSMTKQSVTSQIADMLFEE